MAIVKTLGKLVLVGGLLVATLPYVAALVLDQTSVTEGVVLGNPAAPDTVEFNREQFDDTLKGEVRREAVASLYGQVATGLPTERLLFVDAAAIVHPVEDPTLTLVKQRDGGWRQVKTIYTLAERTLVGGILAALVGFFLMKRGGPGG